MTEVEAALLELERRGLVERAGLRGGQIVWRAVGLTPPPEATDENDSSTTDENDVDDVQESAPWRSPQPRRQRS